MTLPKLLGLYPIRTPPFMGISSSSSTLGFVLDLFAPPYSQANIIFMSLPIHQTEIPPLSGYKDRRKIGGRKLHLHESTSVEEPSNVPPISRDIAAPSHAMA
ncbi:hypothetical protein M9H77_23940 [Catharanthus roseus]|uniref:Uncharacterized protein n=1 Tax=Catharanthus roseus TaxID=4058 RepID=A0ACC0AUB7_CATRO|nr:hypothetical protein M9H77_23940 [Catharanthus roseus]